MFGLSETPQSLLINPGGNVENDWYFGIPFLSQLHTNVGLSGVTAYDLFADNNVPFGDISPLGFIKRPMLLLIFQKISLFLVLKVMQIILGVLLT